MSYLDPIVGVLTGATFDIPTLAQRVGMPPEQVEQAVVALGQAHNQNGDTVQAAAAQTALPADKLSAILQDIGGERALGYVASFLGGGSSDAPDEASPVPDDPTAVG